MKMTEVHSPDGHLIGNGGGGGGGAGAGGPVTVTSSETVGAKRQRRPSVRLGEIGGDQAYDTLLHHHHRRNTNSKPWKQLQQAHLSIDHKKDAYASNKNSKTRALTNLSTGTGDFSETLDEDKELNLDSVAIGSWKSKDSKRRVSGATTKRARSNWASKIDDGGGGGGDTNVEEAEEEEEEEEKYSGGEYVDGRYREFDVENSESPSREQSPIHSLENLGDGSERNERDMYYNRRNVRTREYHHYHHDGIELSGPSETEARDYRNSGGGEDGVRIWLNSLGLGRYAPVFEIHEVDDEVLPMLTLEDLKDMGINAVGSRRKMFCAIQKLGKGFS